jgi:hypothetical protein
MTEQRLHRQLLKGHPVWSFAIYVQDEAFDTDSHLARPIKRFNSKQLKLSRGVRDQADPFLIVHEDYLYVFYEKLLARDVGTIACARTADLDRFEDLGVVLREPHHLSYPFVFHDGGRILMIPEAKQSGEVPLYEFGDFPFQPRKLRSLLQGRYVDSFVLRKDGLWYLFTTSETGLEIHFTENLRSGDFVAHPSNPVVADARYCRNGGGPLHLGNSTFRVAQDCSRSYGHNVSLIRIDELSPATYRESLVRSDYFEKRDRSNRLGAHHLTMVRFLGKTVIAADGASHDFLVNKLFSRLFW